MVKVRLSLWRLLVLADRSQSDRLLDQLHRYSWAAKIHIDEKAFFLVDLQLLAHIPISLRTARSETQPWPGRPLTGTGC